MARAEQERAVTVAMALLRHLHGWGSSWVPPVPEKALLPGQELAHSDPAASTQAVLQLLSRLTKRHAIALKVC